MEALFALTRAGFQRIETALTFEALALTGAGDQVRVRPAIPKDEGAVAEIARRSFVRSRFYLDPLIGKGKAEALQAAWVSNFFQGQRGDAMLVAQTPAGEVAGFILLIDGQEGPCAIDLVAVAEGHRREGFGEALVAAIPAVFPRARTFTVVTQAANVAAVRFYEKAGFRLRGCKMIRLDDTLLREHYAHIAHKPFFPEVQEFPHCPQLFVSVRRF